MKYDCYRSSGVPILGEIWSWNMYGAGIENIGRAGRPEHFPISEPNEEQLLVRVDPAETGFSDLKVIRQSGAHCRLYSSGTRAPLDLSRVYPDNAQHASTSGSALADPAPVIRRTIAGELSPGRSVAAVDGIEATHDGIKAMMAGRFAGKVVICPQIRDLPLLAVDDLKIHYPTSGTRLGSGDMWTTGAEQPLIEKFWKQS